MIALSELLTSAGTSQDEWLVLLGLGETLPPELRLAIAAIASRELDASRLADALEQATLEPRTGPLDDHRLLQEQDLSWERFVRAWLDGMDEEIWFQLPASKESFGANAGDGPLTKRDRVLLDVAYMRGLREERGSRAPESWLDERAEWVTRSIYEPKPLPELQRCSALVRYLVVKRRGDLRLVERDVPGAMESYRIAHELLEKSCAPQIRDHYRPYISLSRLHDVHDERIWTQLCDAMREVYTGTPAAGIVEGVRWRKEFDLDVSRNRYSQYRPTFPIYINSTTSWAHLISLRDRASHHVDAGEPDTAARVTSVVARRALALGAFTALPRLGDLAVRISLAREDYEAALVEQIDVSSKQVRTAIEALPAVNARRLVRTLISRLEALRDVASREGDRREVRIANYAKLLAHCATLTALSIEERLPLLPELLVLATTERGHGLGNVDAAGPAAKAVQSLVEAAGPRRLAPHIEMLARAIPERLQRPGSWSLFAPLIRTLHALSHIDGFMEEHGDSVLDAVLRYLEAQPRPGQPWPVVAPAFGVLLVKSSIRMLGRDPQLRNRALQEAMRHFVSSSSTSKSHADIPLALHTQLAAPIPEPLVAAIDTDIEEAENVHSSDSLASLERLLKRGRLTDAGHLSKIGETTARIVEWRSKEGELAFSISDAPDVIYELGRNEHVPVDTLRRLWQALVGILHLSQSNPWFGASSESLETRRIVLANWVAAAATIAKRAGEEFALRELLARLVDAQPDATAAVQRGLLNAGSGPAQVSDAIGSSEAFYSTLPYLLMTDLDRPAMQLLLSSALRYGPREADIGVFLLVRSAMPPIVPDPDELFDYRWRLDESPFELREVLRPLVPTTSADASPP